MSDTTPPNLSRVRPTLRSTPNRTSRTAASMAVERQSPCPRATTILDGFQAAEVGV
jgi:hypothetical protein